MQELSTGQTTVLNPDLPKKKSKFIKSFKDKLEVKSKQIQTQIDQLGAPILVTDVFVDNPLKILSVGMCILLTLNVLAMSLGFY